jgi:hypothetical protein
MTKLGEAVVLAGAVDNRALNELQRWRLPVEPPDGQTMSGTADEAVAMVRAALESREQVDMRETDLDMLRKYMEGRQRGRLVVIDERTEERVGIDVQYYLTPTGDYVLPYTEEDDVVDRLTNGVSYLKVKQGRVFFSDVKQLYFGQHKYFLSCRGTLEEEGGKHGGR